MTKPLYGMHNLILAQAYRIILEFSISVLRNDVFPYIQILFDILEFYIWKSTYTAIWK